MSVGLIPVTGIGDVEQGDDVATLILDALGGAGVSLQQGDIVVVTHKIVSKAEGATRKAATDAEYRAVVEQEARAVLRRRGDLIIAQTRQGFICANAGVDRSNMPDGIVALHPVDPDRSAHRIRTRLEQASGVGMAVVVTDTFGRAWRRGLTDVAIGVSGLPATLDHRGSVDMYGRVLQVSEVAIVDEIAAAADLVMGKADGVPVAIVRGLDLAGDGRAVDLVRPADEDLFR